MRGLLRMLKRVFLSCFGLSSDEEDEQENNVEINNVDNRRPARAVHDAENHSSASLSGRKRLHQEPVQSQNGSSVGFLQASIKLREKFEARDKSMDESLNHAGQGAVCLFSGEKAKAAGHLFKAIKEAIVEEPSYEEEAEEVVVEQPRKRHKPGKK